MRSSRKSRWEYILSEEGDDGCGTSVQETAGCGSCSSVVNNTSHVLEQPLVWAVSDKEDIFVFFSVHVTPALGDDSTCSTLLYSGEHGIDQLLGVFHDDTSEADVHWGITGIQELLQLIEGLVIRCLSEEESNDICEWREISISVP